MSGRGRRDGRSARGGRGRGRGKTRIWEWEAYTPGAEVYDQLWRVRKEPATVTARLPNVCPMSNARTRILHRRQTEDRFKRELYTVEVTYTGGPGSARDGIALTQLEDVDLQRILQFVSLAELERYETEQFRLEAEAEAIAMRTEAEDLARRQLRKNAKGPNASKGSRVLSALAFSVEPTPRSRGRPRATRGKCRGRARGVEPTRGLVVSSRQLKNDMHEQLVDSEPMVFDHQDDIIPPQPASPQFESDGYVGSRITSMRTLYPGQQSLEHNNEDDAEADATEEFAVEAIVAHFHEHEKNYYLVKWEGYEDSHDWLPEEDLEGAADLVTEYKERIGWRNKKVEIR
ncbi:hypothetical protein J4E90_002374 [Alternaria incomplexa]|uniref:uncharacterized protein n=1 Tax=Alternaria incomplexa TaxID=1187928 RepID=UPI00221F2A1E|nr:uncharacterized protein J4E90_002374 [Alternaria incomplexa]KAI4917994.1 hypothetical protein J4E90_002374 [Alternaria incomplexa]